MKEEIRKIRQKAKQMTRNEVMMKAINKRITWMQAADICGITPRQMRRIKKRYEIDGFDGLQDNRKGKPRRKRIPVETIREICRLKQEEYADYSVQHFYEQLEKEHAIKLSYNWTLKILQTAGIVCKSAARGKYFRKRERKPMVGMMIHMDASTHEWIEGVVKQDLVVTMDDADGRILSGFFLPEEGTMSTLIALDEVITSHGRFCEFYTDRGSHFCTTSKAGEGPNEKQQTQVSQVLETLGIRHILARTPQARGRSERAFGTIQGRLPQELRRAKITTYPEANDYLREVFIPDFNQRFTVKPAQEESAFVQLIGIDTTLLFSIKHKRIVKNDHTVSFNRVILQLPQPKERMHYVRCPVTVHELINESLAISYQGKSIATYTKDGEIIHPQGHSQLSTTYQSPPGPPSLASKET